jgi:hypothetical protein
MLERFEVTEEVYRKRNMANGQLSAKRVMGDAFVQTRNRILGERKYAPGIILSSTLKTASSETMKDRRYFDTPGYYFDVVAGKSLHFKGKGLTAIRLVVNFGFLCWETTGSQQNDAPLYGAKLILVARRLSFENTLAGYRGWMKNGDAPLVYTSRLWVCRSPVRGFAEYQYGINDFPYHHLRLGLAFRLPILTPRW